MMKYELINSPNGGSLSLYGAYLVQFNMVGLLHGRRGRVAPVAL